MSPLNASLIQTCGRSHLRLLSWFVLRGRSHERAFLESFVRCQVSQVFVKLPGGGHQWQGQGELTRLGYLTQLRAVFSPLLGLGEELLPIPCFGRGGNELDQLGELGTLVCCRLWEHDREFGGGFDRSCRKLGVETRADRLALGYPSCAGQWLPDGWFDSGDCGSRCAFGVHCGRAGRLRCARRGSGGGRFRRPSAP
jgi:hypothetical protein